MDNLDLLVKELCKMPAETGWVEFPLGLKLICQ